MSTPGKPFLRRSAAVAALVGAILIGGGAVAVADGTPVGLGPVRVAANRGDLSVAAWTDAPGAHVSTVTATVRDGGTDVTTVDLTDTDGDSVWSTSTPLELVEDGGVMPHLGHYTVSVTATDSTGTSATRDGGLDFTLRPTLVWSDYATGFNGAGVLALPTYDRQTAIVSGTLEALRPGSSAHQPLADAAVTVIQQAAAGAPQSDAQTVTTDAHGVFTTAPFHQGTVLNYHVAVALDGDDVHGSFGLDIWTSLSQAAATVTGTGDHTVVEVGQTLTVTGKVTRGTAHTPVAGATVEVALPYSPQSYARDAVTGADGSYRVSLPAVNTAPYPGYWTATLVDPFLFGSVQGQVAVPMPSAFTRVGIAIAASGKVTATGAFGSRYDLDDQTSYQAVYLDYSPNGTTGWRQLAGVQSQYGTFSVSAYGYVDGYYRLRHPASTALGSALTTPVRRYRTDTYVFGNNAAPEPIVKGRTLTVTGTLDQKVSGKWAAMAHTRIYLYFKAAGTTSYVYVTAGTTDTLGRISLHGVATKDGYWELHYFGDSTHFDSGATPDYVDVR